MKNTNKLTRCGLAAISAVMALLLSSSEAAVLLSTSTSAPGNTNINQSLYLNTGADLNSTIQSRDVSAGNIRGAAQVFTWNSSLALDKFGFRVSLAQDNSSATGWDTSWNFTNSQNYTLYVQQLNASNTVVSTLATESITLTSSLINAGEYLVIDLVSDISLVSGTKYAICLTPQDQMTQVIFWDNDTTSDIYAGGWSQQWPSLGAPTVYTSATNDMTFFTVAVPEPSFFSLVTGAGVFCAIMRRRKVMA